MKKIYVCALVGILLNKIKQPYFNKLYPYSDIRCFTWQVMSVNGPTPEYLNQLTILSSFVIGCILNKRNSNLKKFWIIVSVIFFGINQHFVANYC